MTTTTIKYYDYIIEDEQLLIDYGFTRFRLPVNGGGSSSNNNNNNNGAAKLILDNDQNRRLITYAKFDRTDLDKSVELLRNQIEDEQIIESELGKDVVEIIITNFYNLGKQLRSDPDSLFFKSKNGNVNGNGKSRSKESESYEDEDQILASKQKISEADIEFIINTMKKEAECDVLSIKQLFYGMASAFTKRPIYHLVNSKEAGAGKNYLLELVSRYWPDKYVFPLGNMSDKAIFHRKGMLVIIDEQTGEERPLKPILTSLQSKIDELKDEIESEKDNKEPQDRDKSKISENKKELGLIL
jgi:hypothetical protein